MSKKKRSILKSDEDSLDEVVKNLGDSIDSMIKRTHNIIDTTLKNLGMLEENINLFYEGKKEFKICPECKTLNYRETYTNKKKHYDKYSCNNCGHSEKKYYTVL